MTQPTISAERIEEMLTMERRTAKRYLEGTYSREHYEFRAEVFALALSSLRAQAPGSEAVAWPNPKAALSEHEAISAGRALDQWRASLKRPDLSDEDRVRGAIEAYQRQAFALADLAFPPVQAQPQVKQTMLLVENYVSATLREARGSAETWEKDVTSVGDAKRLLLAALTAGRAAVAQEHDYPEPEYAA